MSLKSDSDRGIFVCGGHYARADQCSAGLIVQANLEAQTTNTLLSYISPEHLCANDVDEPSILFKAGYLCGDHFYACTTTEILKLDYPSFKIVDQLSLPIFNDLHHVMPTSQNTLLVAVTGLDLVVEVDWQGSTLHEWNISESNPTWTRFSKSIDYRHVNSTKPHDSHPNFVFEADGRNWASMCNQGNVVSLDEHREQVSISPTRIHDGVRYKDLHYFTSVNGHVVIVDMRKKKIIDDIDLNEFSPDPLRALGWCRGICILDDDHVLVGFSRLRPTKWRENVQWVKNQFSRQSGTRPTRIAKYNLSDRKMISEVNLETAKLGSVFSIHCK